MIPYLFREILIEEQTMKKIQNYGNSL